MFSKHEITSILNNNQGVIAVVLFIATIVLGWITGFFKWLFKFLSKSNKTESSHPITNTNTVINNISMSTQQSTNIDSHDDNSEKRKKLTNILFVDDRKDFKVVSILKNSGWKNTKIKSDLKSLDDTDLVSAHICFIDVQGVGKLLQFKDEGLGLTIAIKKKYPTKKVIIYSAQSEGDRFHEALRIADATLRKDADPYEFQNLVEEFSRKAL